MVYKVSLYIITQNRGLNWILPVCIPCATIFASIYSGCIMVTSDSDAQLKRDSTDLSKLELKRLSSFRAISVVHNYIDYTVST